MSDSSTTRIKKAREYVENHLKTAQHQKETDFPEFHKSTEIYQILTDFIEVKSKGFRGVLVTALAGMHLNNRYDPLNNFYDCKPRAIFEKGIWYALDQYGIPCGKSDPLNVAKKAKILNKEWAEGRRPQKAAEAVVDFLTKVTHASETDRKRLVDYFFFRLTAYAKRINEYEIEDFKPSQLSRQTLNLKIIDFTLDYPESGQLPQFLITQLLNGVYQHSLIKVCGGNASVFETNTTSKKPADIWLEKDGEIFNLYEITVKKVDQKRLDDILGALRSTNHMGKSVTFICQLPDNVSELEVENGGCLYKGGFFNFVDYKSFCSSLFALLSDIQIENLLKNLRSLIKDKNTSEKTKKGWNTYFQE